MEFCGLVLGLDSHELLRFERGVGGPAEIPMGLRGLLLETWHLERGLISAALIASKVETLCLALVMQFAGQEAAAQCLCDASITMTTIRDLAVPRNAKN